jgi:hypothetical protein
MENTEYTILNWELFDKLKFGESKYGNIKFSLEPLTYDSLMKQMKEEYEQNKDNPEYIEKLIDQEKNKKINYYYNE